MPDTPLSPQEQPLDWNFDQQPEAVPSKDEPEGHFEDLADAAAAEDADLGDKPVAGAGNEPYQQHNYLPPDEEDPWTKGEVPDQPETPVSPRAPLTQPVAGVDEEPTTARSMPIVYYDGCRRQARESVTITVRRRGNEPVFEVRVDGREISMLNPESLVIHLAKAREYVPGILVLGADGRPTPLESIEGDFGTAQGGKFREMLANIRRIIALPNPRERAAIPTTGYEQQLGN